VGKVSVPNVRVVHDLEARPEKGSLVTGATLDITNFFFINPGRKPM